MDPGFLSFFLFYLYTFLVKSSRQGETSGLLTQAIRILGHIRSYLYKMYMTKLNKA